MSAIEKGKEDGVQARERRLEGAIGGAYEMPDGRKFWIDAAVAKEIVRRIQTATNGDAQ